MENELYHWGVKGMKWGVRRHQSKDRTPINSGKKRDSKNSGKKELTPEQKTARTKKIIEIGVAATAIVLANYGSYKLSQHIENVNMKKKRNAAMAKAFKIDPSDMRVFRDFELGKIGGGITWR